VLEEALREGTESLLVLDDDVLLHKDTRTLFAEAFKQLPDDWLILQLGTLQYNWSPPWAEWYSPMLYRTNGSAIGSHAVGMRFDVIPYLLDHVRRFDMPYDIGALSAATRAFADRCFVVSPNLAIQSLVDSDIGTSDFQKGKKREEAAATYRWHIDDYL
jgi:GR25 family glycosyltransferase involved in LPS biosynthesis